MIRLGKTQISDYNKNISGEATAGISVSCFFIRSEMVFR